MHSLLATLATAATVPENGGTVIHAFGETATFKLTADQTRGAFSLWEERTPPGGGPPLHYHLHEDEVFLVVEGRMSFQLDSRWNEFGPGAVVFAPRRVPHTFCNRSDQPARMYILTTPGGFENYLARCAAEFARPGAPDMNRIVAISAEHGIHFLDAPQAG
jgi:mannose-6-phosphate isomerase-like protein (cupin superfamily)